MRRSAAGLLAAALLAACARDVDLPPANRLAFAQPFRTAAPRQVLADLQVSGGAGGYVYAFAQGGRLSGDDATVDPATGAYRAGRRGSAQDVVQVTDAGGATATVRISVGPPLSVTPPIGGTAPGGALAFTVSGGLPPYAVTIPRNRSGATLGQAGATVRYTAGATGAVVDGLRVTDATADPDAAATVEVSVGIALDAFPSARTVAPHDSATVVGTGGAPPYRYQVKTKRSGAEATITPAGLYTAGGTGGVDDEIEVRDANQQTASFFMHVGPALALSLDGAAPDPRPGVAIGLVATGGKPPYAYRFVRGGNRSGGAVDGTTGVYVPGPASGAVDLFEVSDQTGRATAQLSNPTPVGAIQLATGSLNRVCASGDLDGDGVDDLLVANDFFTRLGVLMRIGSAAPRLDAYAMHETSGLTSFLAVEDVNGDGRAEVFLHSVDGPIRTFFPDPLGQLVAGPTLEFGLAPDVGAGRVVAVRDAVRGTWFASTRDGGGGPLVGWRWDAMNRAFAPANPSAVGFPGGNVLGLAAGDVDGDGYPDLVYLREGASNLADGTLYVSYGTVTGDFEAAVATSVVVPAGHAWPAEREWGTPYARLLAVPASAGRVGGVLVRVQDAAGRGALVTARVTRSGATRAWAVNGPYDLRPAWPGPWGLVAVPRSTLAGSETLYVGYDLQDGHLLGVVLDPIGLVPHAVEVDPGPRVSRIDCVTFPDVNADGAPDLVAVGQFMQTSDLLLGSGDSTTPRPDGAPWFGGRVHRRGLGFPASTADVDGDGLADLVAWDGRGLSVYVGGGGQVGELQRLSTQLVMGNAAGPLFAPQVAGTAIVFHDQQQTFYAALPDGKGGFDPPYALTVTVPAGGPYTGQVFAFQYATFGGPALVGPGAVFLPRGPGRLLAVPMPPHPLGRSAEKCAFAPAGAQPGPAATVLMACQEQRTQGVGNESDLVVYRTTATGLDGAAPAFGAWQLVEHQQNADIGAQLTMMNTLFGGGALLDGGPWFAAFDDRAEEFRIVTFDPALAPTTQQLAVPGARLENGMMGGAIAVSLRPASPDDLLLTTSTSTVLARRGAGGRFAVVQELRGGLALPVGAGPLAPGQPPYVLTTGAGLFAGDAGTEVVPVPTEAGFLK